MRYADTDAVPTSGGTNGVLPDKIYLQARTGVRGELFANSIPADLPNTDQGVSTYPYALEMYYLRPCSDPGAGGICGAASDGGHPIPTLMRLRLTDAGALINEPVVEGVEQLQFEYGVHAPGSTDPTPTQYVSADEVTAGSGSWADVTAVRVAYVLRSQTRDTGLPHDFDSGDSTDTGAATYATRLSSNCEYGITPTGGAKNWSCDNYTSSELGGTPQQFTRAQMTSVVQVRNRMRLVKG
ncbi:MAG: PilW family protein [Mycobacterium sp.]